MKVVITGSAGFIASHLVEHLLINTNWQIIGLDSFRHKGDSLRVQGDRFNDPRYMVFYHDLNSPISRRLQEKIGSVDYVINMASESHVDRSISDPVPFVQNNVNLILNILEYVREVKPKKFIQMSTDEVYGPAKKGYAHKEWDVILPSNPYSASKAAQEAIAISYWRTYNVPLIITNVMNLIGERQDKEKFLPILISKISKDEEVTIHGTEFRISGRCYQHARNLCDALVHLLKFVPPIEYQDTDDVIKPSRYNIVGEKYLNNLEFANLVANLMGKQLKYKFIDYHLTRPGHDHAYRLDGAAMTRLGWKQPKTLEESLQKTIGWYLSNPEWLI